jgi:uncharacterized membrane protein
MWKKIFSIIVIVLLFISVYGSLQLIPSASANLDDSIPVLSMPIEHVNYTITNVNGTLWAKIDGEYPIYIQNQFNGDMPMVYPMPPGTTNIHVWLDGQELSWSNYTQSNPDALHQTAIGDWWMIYSVLPNVSGFYMLRIHYEHPLEIVNGNYLFLYDLNISPYLSEENQNSTAYFTVRMETNTTDLQVYTAPPDSVASEWKPINYTTTTENKTTVVRILMYSEYPGISGKPLPGDLVVEFSNANRASEFSIWLIVLVAVLLVAVLSLIVAFNVTRRRISV